MPTGENSVGSTVEAALGWHPFCDATETEWILKNRVRGRQQQHEEHLVRSVVALALVYSGTVIVFTVSPGKKG